MDVNNLTDEGISSLSLKTEENVLETLRKQDIATNNDKLTESFELYDQDGDGFLNEKEFGNLLNHLFTNKGQSYQLTDKLIQDTLKLLDENQDGRIDFKEFETCWYHWFKQILDPKSALIIVDVQNDFISGTLAINSCPAGQDGAAVIPIINSLLENAAFDVVVYSSDWHPGNHISFVENVHDRKIHKSSKVTADDAQMLSTVIFAGPPIMEQRLWPAHCVQDTWGAKLHEDLIVNDCALHIYKGTNPDIDSYSAFWDNQKLSKTGLLEQLTERKITDVYVCGLAYDICVGATALHSLEHGFRTVLIEDACRGVDIPTVESTRAKLERQGAVVVESASVADMVDAMDRRPELGYQAALNVAMAINLLKQDDHRKKLNNSK